MSLVPAEESPASIAHPGLQSPAGLANTRKLIARQDRCRLLGEPPFSTLEKRSFIPHRLVVASPGRTFRVPR